jgi:hypothetical protein
MAKAPIEYVSEQGKNNITFPTEPDVKRKKIRVMTRNLQSAGHG